MCVCVCVAASPRDVLADVLKWDIVASEFESQSRYYVTFRIISKEKDMNPLITPAIG